MFKMIMVVIRVVIRIILSNVHRCQGFGDQNAIDDANWELAVLLQQEGQMLFLMVMWVVMSLLMIPEINDNYKW